MRAPLLGLGFIGAEYKQLRRDLLARLEGDSAWAKSLKPASPTADPVGSLNKSAGAAGVLQSPIHQS